MKKTHCFIATMLLALPLGLSGQSSSQPPAGQQPDGSQPGKPKWERRGMMREGERGMVGMPFGMWWKNPDVIQQLGLSDAQTQKIDQIFQEHRLRLIDLHAELEKQESLLQPLVDADQPDEAKVMAQVDKVAQARAALERSNASMMLAIRRLLSPEQWKKLEERNPGRRHFDGPGGPPPRPNGDGSDD
jgi:protein CpxP